MQNNNNIGLGSQVHRAAPPSPSPCVCRSGLMQGVRVVHLSLSNTPRSFLQTGFPGI